MSIDKFIAKNSFIVAMIMGISALLGLLRESVIAHMFGFSGVTDAYLVAMIVPTVFSGVIGGSFLSTFIAVYSEYLAHNKNKEALYLSNILFSISFVFVLVLLIIMILFAPIYVKLIAPSYTGELYSLTVTLTRILMPSFLFGIFVYIAVGINSSHYSFTISSINKIVSNLVIVLSVIILGSFWGIYGLAIGTLLSGIAELLIQLYAMCKRGHKFKFSLDIKNEGIRAILFLSIPMIFTALAAHLNLYIDRFFAAKLPEGSISALYFANKLVFFPQNIITASVGMVVYPIFVRAVAKNEWSKLSEGITRAIRLIFLIIFPAGILIYVMREQFIHILFEHGAFNENSTRITSDIVPYFMGAMIFVSFTNVLMYIYLSMKKMTATLLINMVITASNIILSYLLVEKLKQNGLALAYSISSFIGLIIILYGMKFFLNLDTKGKYPFRTMIIYLGKVILSSLIMGFIILYVYNMLGYNYMTEKMRIISCIALVLLSIKVYCFTSYLIGVEEIKAILGIVFRMLLR